MVERNRIDFELLKRRLLDAADRLVPDWLPGGRFQGREYVCADLSGGEGGSCSVNVKGTGERAGCWSDFSTDDRGKDLISLYAAIKGLTQIDAARELAGQMGMDGGNDVQTPASPPAPRPQTDKPARVDEGWKTQRPVPAHAPKPTFRHQSRQPEDIEHLAEYRTGNDLHGYVVRFLTSDGGKETLPYTWCVSARSASARWHWKHFDAPRPLYLPGHELPGARTVVLVEGEKKADALQRLLDDAMPGIYCVVSWPGGSNGWPKAEWAWLAGCHVLAWPDCDAKREKLTSAEKAATPDKLAQKVLQQSKPLLSEHEQPGMQAMLGIGAELRDVHGCRVDLLPIPKPGDVIDGWDCGDAITTDRWEGEQVLGLFARAFAMPRQAIADKLSSKAAARPAVDPYEPPRDRPAGATPVKHRVHDDEDDPFQDHLDFMCDSMKCKVWDIGINRKLVISALQKSSALQGCLGFNELTSAPGTLRPWPWRDNPGLLNEKDDLRLGDWLSDTYKLKAASRTALAEAIDTVADKRRYHPVRDWLNGLEHDGTPRLERWLIHTLGMDPATVPKKRQRYFALIGKYMLMGLVARVFDPGVKFEYSPVFEGKTGMGKSTLVKTLVGADYFSDTHFDIGNGKDGMEQLEGLWAYELSEMTAFKRADSEQVKQFFSSTVDRFRGAYGKFVQPHPRQCVIFCTTNKRQYLYDLTGNRRFWPVWIEQRIRLAWLSKWRGQLFAEALAAYRRGERIFPTPEEEDEFFLPEQELRLVQTTVQSKLHDLLTRDGSHASEGKISAEITRHTAFVTLHALVQALGADAAKSTSLLEGQIRSWLDSQGWMHHREGTGQRRWGYLAPDVWPPKYEDDGASEASAAQGADEIRPDTPSQRGVPMELPDDEPF